MKERKEGKQEKQHEHDYEKQQKKLDKCPSMAAETQKKY
jgi:hypothetical protein